VQATPAQRDVAFFSGVRSLTAVESAYPEAVPLRTSVGCLALLWVFPGSAVAVLGSWSIETDAPTSASIHQANVFLGWYFVGLLAVVILWAFLRRQDRLRAAGQVSATVDATVDPFARAKLELQATGKRRVFVCGRCGKGISLGWKRCEHCKATFDAFPPVDTGQVV
jgi:hypothetical protein